MTMIFVPACSCASCLPVSKWVGAVSTEAQGLRKAVAAKSRKVLEGAAAQLRAGEQQQGQQQPASGAGAAPDGGSGGEEEQDVNWDDDGVADELLLAACFRPHASL